MNRLGAILYMDSIVFLENKSSSCRKGQSYNNSDKSPERKLAEENVENWTIEYIVDRLFFEMLELKDDAQGWEDYQHKGQREKYYSRAHDAIKMAAGRPPPILIVNTSDLTIRLKRELSELKVDTLDYVVTEAIGRVCENVNPKLYHLTLKKCVGWRFED
jgi:hypothetical protein